VKFKVGRLLKERVEHLAAEADRLAGNRAKDDGDDDAPTAPAPKRPITR
jgi:hypothetical protein